MPPRGPECRQANGNFQLRSPSSSVSQPPPPRQAQVRGPARGSPRQAAKCVPSTPRLRPPGAPQGLGTGGSWRCPAPGGVLGNSALGSRTPFSTRVPRPVPGARAPAPRRSSRAGPWTRVRPALPAWATGGDGPQEGGRDGGTQDPAAAAYLGPGQRSSRAALAPQSGPKQRAAGAGGGSCSALGPAAPAHPRPPPRCASCGQSGSLRSRRRGARASEHAASTERARIGHEAGTEQAGARARGARGCGAGSER